MSDSAPAHGRLGIAIALQKTRPLGDLLVTVYSLTIDGSPNKYLVEAYCHVSQKRETGFYDLYVSRVLPERAAGQRPREILDDDVTLAQIHDAILAHFKAHGQFDHDEPPRSVVLEKP